MSMSSSVLIHTLSAYGYPVRVTEGSRRSGKTFTLARWLFDWYLRSPGASTLWATPWGTGIAHAAVTDMLLTWSKLFDVDLLDIGGLISVAGTSKWAHRFHLEGEDSILVLDDIPITEWRGFLEMTNWSAVYASLNGPGLPSSWVNCDLTSADAGVYWLPGQPKKEIQMV